MLKLYVRTGCPFCERVLSFMNEAGVVFEEKNINSEENTSELLEVGGRSQVPFLIDDEKNVKLYESSEIIEYIQKNYMQT